MRVTILDVAAHLPGMNTSRVPAGIPTGGQFSPQTHGEADVDLSAGPAGDIEANRGYYVEGIIDLAEDVTQGRLTRASAYRVTGTNLGHLSREQVEEAVDGAVEDIAGYYGDPGTAAAHQRTTVTLARFDTQRRLAEQKAGSGTLMRQHIDRFAESKKQMELVSAKTAAEEIRTRHPQARYAVLSASDTGGDMVGLDGLLDGNDQVIEGSDDDLDLSEPSQEGGVSAEEAISNLYDNSHWTQYAEPEHSPRLDGQPGGRFTHVDRQLGWYGGTRTYLDLDKALAHEPKEQL